ncbi:MAG: MBL fold metallo-hydrolase [Firmicutes bacterium]|nr:MBL fold metallo-hydrolase [Bacillota bacterium]
MVHFIDVGQGDSILVQTPGGKNMLVDAGGWPGELDSGEGAGQKVVVPYLRRLGVRRLNVLVITHPHEDHAGGMRAVVEAFPVDLVLVSPVGGTGSPSVSAGAHSRSSDKVPLTYRTLLLKIPHHGSRYLLPSFLEKTHPDVAVISVGRHNNFGHPAPETLEHLARMPVRVYRTDLDGAVILRTDGKHIFVRTGRQRRAA